MKTNLTVGEMSLLRSAIYSHQRYLDREMYCGDAEQDKELSDQIKAGNVLIKKLEQDIKLKLKG